MDESVQARTSHAAEEGRSGWLRGKCEYEWGSERVLRNYACGGAESKCAAGTTGVDAVMWSVRAEMRRAGDTPWRSPGASPVNVSTRRGCARTFAGVDRNVDR